MCIGHAEISLNIAGMAYFQYLSEVQNDCLQSNFQNILEELGLNISEEFSTHAQIFAEESDNKSKNYKSKVNVLISWSNKTLKECSIEIRSDEPLRKGTCCETLTERMLALIPPKQPFTPLN